VLAEPLATPALVVVAGGLARRHPAVVEAVRAALPDRVVEASAAPPSVKSAAAWGLALAWDDARDAVA
jgi:predicted NBD/HSP70 family sugar kinase